MNLYAPSTHPYAPCTHRYAPIRSARHKQAIINVERLQNVARAPDPWRKLRRTEGCSEIEMLPPPAICVELPPQAIHASRMVSVYSTFETELSVRPDDIDMNQHVHGSRYFDYVLAARYDQMARCYRMPMEDFLRHGYGWFVKTAHMEYKRPLRMGDCMMVRTRVEEISRTDVKVRFEILKQPANKLCCDGYFDYTMISLKTNRAEPIPDWIREKYSV